jgi:hypothetical protein
MGDRRQPTQATAASASDAGSIRDRRVRVTGSLRERTALCSDFDAPCAPKTGQSIACELRERSTIGRQANSVWSGAAVPGLRHSDRGFESACEEKGT